MRDQKSSDTLAELNYFFISSNKNKILKAKNGFQ